MKEDALAKIEVILKDNNNTKDDFKFLFDTLDLIESAHIAMANSYVLRYFLIEKGASDEWEREKLEYLLAF